MYIRKTCIDRIDWREGKTEEIPAVKKCLSYMELTRGEEVSLFIQVTLPHKRGDIESKKRWPSVLSNIIITHQIMLVLVIDCRVCRASGVWSFFSCLGSQLSSEVWFGSCTIGIIRSVVERRLMNSPVMIQSLVQCELCIFVRRLYSEQIMCYFVDPICHEMVGGIQCVFCYVVISWGIFLFSLVLVMDNLQNVLQPMCCVS